MTLPLRYAPLAVLALLSACGNHVQAPAPTAPSPLTSMAVTAATVAREQALDGVLEAVNQATVSAQVAGRIVELPVDVNTAVKQGDVLARLRDAEPRARLQAAQATLKEAQAEYERVKSVFDKKLVAQAMMDRATAARANAQAAYENAAEQENHALVRAPYAGIVTARHMQVGELASPGQPVVTLLSLDRLRAVVDVPQQFVGALRDQPGARVLLPDGGTVTAASVTLFPYADERTHSFRARVEFPGAGPHDVFPGQLVKVIFKVGETTALPVPASALAQRGEVSGLYVINAQQQPEFRAVRAGTVLADGRIAIDAGLQAGERVATDPLAAARWRHQQAGASP